MRPDEVSPVGWDADSSLHHGPMYRPLDSDIEVDLCVVGLGGSGLAAVSEGLRRGLRVAAVDAGRVGAGAAGRNGGFLLAGPSGAVHQASEVYGAESAVALYRQTLDELQALRDDLGAAAVRDVGSIRLAGLPGAPESEDEAFDRGRESADCAAQYGFMRAYRLKVELYDGPLGKGLFFPKDAAVNPVLRVFGLARLYSASAQLFEYTRALHIGPNQVTTAKGMIHAPVIVVAVDGRLEQVFPELRDIVRTARLQMMCTAPLVDTRRLPCPVYGRWGFDYAQQDPSGRLFVGGGRDIFERFEWTGADTTTGDVQGYLRKIGTRFAGGDITITHRWAASVGYTNDGRPLVTKVRPGVIACGGYNGTGNLIGPLAARAAVALGFDKEVPPVWFNSAGTL